MAQYYGSIRTHRRTISRVGHKTTGIAVMVDSWASGCEAEVKHEDGYDHFYVYKTGGSNNPDKKVLVADWFEKVGE